MSTDKFMSHFKMPKSEINKIRKDFAISKTASESLNPDQLKNFREISDSYFDFFEELTGKKVNRAVMIAHVGHYLDEGFDLDDLKLYSFAQLKAPFYKENPEKLTVSNLFPIKDQDRINIVWDQLAFHQSKRNAVREEVLKGIEIHLDCGHSKSLAEYKPKPYCMTCVLSGIKLEIARNPYAEEIQHDMQEFASFFRRQESDLTLEDYQKRTVGAFKTIAD